MMIQRRVLWMKVFPWLGLQVHRITKHVDTIHKYVDLQYHVFLISVETSVVLFLSHPFKNKCTWTYKFIQIWSTDTTYHIHFIFSVVDRQAKVLGVDTPSIDISTNLQRPVHVLVLGNNVPVLEYAANLDSIPPNGTTIFLGAIKIRGGSGGAVRAVAILDDVSQVSVAGCALISRIVMLLSVCFTCTFRNVR